MNVQLLKLLDIASLILPPISSLAKADKTRQLANDVAQVVSSVVGEIEDIKEIEAKLKQDAALVAELKRRLEIVTDNYQELKNREFIEDQNEALEIRSTELARETADHRRNLERIANEIEDTESARSLALGNAKSERWWIRWINPVMSVGIVLAFFYFVHLIATEQIGAVTNTVEASVGLELSQDERSSLSQEQQELYDSALEELKQQEGQQQQVRDVFYVAFGALATAFVTVVGFHFGSSYGSKRKTQLQRLYGTQGVLSGGPVSHGLGETQTKEHEVGTPTDTLAQKVKGALTGKKSNASMHPFERFWTENLSHIDHFNWRELLEKGASNTGKGINSDPPEELYGNVVPLVNALENIRKEIGAPVKLISVYRNREYNDHVGGAKNSRHMQFDAADFQVLGNNVGSPTDWSDIAKRLRREGVFEGGVGTYRTFVHVDTRGTRADWNG